MPQCQNNTFKKVLRRHNDARETVYMVFTHLSYKNINYLYVFFEWDDAFCLLFDVQCRVGSPPLSKQKHRLQIVDSLAREFSSIWSLAWSFFFRSVKNSRREEWQQMRQERWHSWNKDVTWESEKRRKRKKKREREEDREKRKNEKKDKKQDARKVASDNEFPALEIMCMWDTRFFHTSITKHEKYFRRNKSVSLVYRWFVTRHQCHRIVNESTWWNPRFFKRFCSFESRLSLVQLFHRDQKRFFVSFDLEDT